MFHKYLHRDDLRRPVRLTSLIDWLIDWLIDCQYLLHQIRIRMGLIYDAMYAEQTII